MLKGYQWAILIGIYLIGVVVMASPGFNEMRLAGAAGSMFIGLVLAMGGAALGRRRGERQALFGMLLGYGVFFLLISNAA